MNTIELLAWADTQRPFDDMTYCGVDVTLATVKRAIREAIQEAREEIEALAVENHHLLHKAPLDPRECRRLLHVQAWRHSATATGQVAAMSANPLPPSRPLGPNVKKLIAKRMATLAIPPGTKDAFGVGLAALMNSALLQANARQATAEILAAIDAVKEAPDNQWGNDDETIAGELLRAIDARRS